MKKYFIISVFLLMVIFMSCVSTTIIYTKCVAGNDSIVEIRKEAAIQDAKDLERIIYK